MKKINIVSSFYYKLALLLKQIFFYALIFFLPPFLYNFAYDYYFEITNYHFKFFLCVRTFIFISTFFISYFLTPPRKLTKLERREQRKLKKKLKKKRKKKKFGLYHFCLTFLLFFSQNIDLIEAIVILHHPLFYYRLLILKFTSQIILLKTLLLKHLKRALMKNLFFESCSQLQFKETLNLINVRIKDNLTNEGQFIRINPSSKIKTLVEFVEKIYDKNYTNIRYKGKSLMSQSVQDLLLWDDYQIHDNSEIEVILETLDGGARRKNKTFKKRTFKCQGNCEKFWPKNYLCLCGYCKECRAKFLGCNCCRHIGCKRCFHCGNCPDCQKDIFFGKKEKCSYCSQNEDIRERDYNDKTLQKRSLQKQIPSPNNYENNNNNLPPLPYFSYPSFPILDYGTRKDFPNLTDSRWISFQCCVFWDFCFANNLKVYPTLTNKFFLKNKFANIFNLQDLWDRYNQNEISVSNFLLNSQSIEQELNDKNLCANAFCENLEKQFITPLVDSIILFNQDWPQFTLTDILEQIIYRLNNSHSFFVEQSFFHPILFRFSIQAFKSSSDVLNMVQNDIFLSPREKKDHIHQTLFSLLFTNPTKLKNEELHEIFGISKHLIKESLMHINDFKLGKVKTLKREYKPRQIFDQKTFDLIDEFYKLISIPWEGTRMASGRLENGMREKHHVHFLHKPLMETYYHFCFHPDFGPKCRTVNNKRKIPKPSLFFQRKPYWIKPHPDVRTGFCSLCLKMNAYVETFQKIVKENCECNDVKCPTFKHEYDCCRILHPETKLCQQCEKCCCKECSECKVSELTRSTSQFMKILSCNAHQIGGIDYPQLDCFMNPKTCACSVCHLSCFEDILKNFCPKLSNNIDWSKQVKTKDWKKEEVLTTKKPFKVWVLESKEINVYDFLEDFEKFLNKNQGFVWHYHMHNLQRYHYNQMIKNFQNGVYGDDVIMAVIDWAESYVIKDSTKLSGAQFFTNKKGQIHGLIEFSNSGGKFVSCSNFIFSNQNIRKDPANSVGDVKKMILGHLKKNKNLKVVHIFSDGSTKEFLNRKTFGNLKKLSKELKIKIIWNFFGNNHGKNLCDSEFARLKIKLDREFVDWLKENDLEKFSKTAEGITKFCKEKLNEWSCNGEQVKQRGFHFRKFNEEPFEDFEALKNVKSYRCVMWDEEGNFYRRNNSCSCEACVVRPLTSTSSECPHNLSGSWTLEEIFPINIDNLLNSDSHEINSETPDDNSDLEVMSGDEE